MFLTYLVLEKFHSFDPSALCYLYDLRHRSKIFGIAFVYFQRNAAYL